jgi:prenyltransferase beta subunit
LELLGQEIPNRENCVNWLKSCQGKSGGFRLNFSPGEGTDFTSSGLSALKMLGSSPLNEEKCIRWIKSCQNPDGGFGWQPLATSTIDDTFSAICSLKLLLKGGADFLFFFE